MIDGDKFQMFFDGTQVTIPENWKSFVPSIKRHRTYMSRFVEYSEENMILVKDAKDYADNAYLVDGVGASVDVVFKELDPSTLTYVNTFSLGKLSFKPGEYKRMRDRTEVSFQPVEFIGNFLARDEVTTELQSLVNMDGGSITTFTNETISVTFDNYLLKSVGLYSTKSYAASDTFSSGSVYYPIFLKNKISGTNEVIDIETTYEGSTTLISDNLIISESGSGIITVNGNFSVSVIMVGVAPYVRARLRLFYRINNGTSVLIDTDQVLTSQMLTDDELTVTCGNISVSLSDGDTLIMYATVDDFIDSTLTSITAYPSTFYINQDTTYSSTTLKGMLAWEYVLRCCQKITGRNDCLRSSYLGRYDGEVYQYGTTSADDGDGAYMFYSNVYQLRGYPIADYPIKASLRQAFKNVNTTGLVGLGIVYEDVMGVSTPFISIEKLEDFYDASTVVMTLNAQDPGISWEGALEYTWSTVKSGYTNFEEDETGTLGTIWGTREYTIADIDKELGKTYNVESEMITSIELIEALRRKRYDANATKDEAYNRKTIALLVKRSGSNWVRVKNENFSSTNGINNPSTASNIDISPARVTAAHAPLLLCGLANRIESTPATVSFLKFQSGEANTDADTTISGEPTIYEDGNIDIDDIPISLDDPIFNANEKGTFTALMSKAQRDLFTTGFNGVIAVVDGDTTYYGFPEEYRLIDLEKPTAQIKFVKRFDLSDYLSDYLAYYKFDNSPNDESANGYDLTLNGSPSYVNDKDGNANSALGLNGSTQSANQDTFAGDVASNEVGSISAWFYFRETTSAQVICAFGDTDANTRLMIDVVPSNNGTDPNSVRVISQPPAGRDFFYVTDDPLVTSNWYHVAVVQDGTQVKVYVNGSLWALTAKEAVVDAGSWLGDCSGLDNFYIGAINYNSLGVTSHANFDFDNVRYYDRILSEIEISYIFNNYL